MLLLNTNCKTTRKIRAGALGGEHEYDYSGDSRIEQIGTKKSGVVGFTEVKNTPEK